MKTIIMREYNEKEYMGEEPELLCYYVKNCYTNAKPCPAEKKNQKVLISVVPPLFHTLSCSITDTEVNVKKRKNAPTQEETKSQTLIGFAYLLSLL